MKQFGIITYIVYKLFYFLKFLPPQVFIEERIKSQIRIADFSPEDKQKEVVKRVFKTEGMILSYLAIYFLTIASSQAIIDTSWLRITVIILISLRLIDIIQVNVNVAVFDAIRTGEGTKADNKLHSLVRAIVLVSYGFIEVAIIFGLFYSLVQEGKLLSCDSPLELGDRFYFSFITQLTIGYGEITPVGFGKVLTCSQGLIGYFFSILIISRLLSSLPRIDSKIK